MAGLDYPYYECKYTTSNVIKWHKRGSNCGCRWDNRDVGILKVKTDKKYKPF